MPRGALLEDARDVGNLDQIAAFGIEEGTGLRAIEQRRGLAVGRHNRRHAGALGSQFFQVRAPRVELIDERLQGRRFIPLRAEALSLRGRRLDLAGRTFEAVGKLPASGCGIRCNTAGAFGSRPSHREATVQLLDGFRRLGLRRGGGGKLRESIRGRLSVLQRLPRLVPRKVGAGFSLLQRRELLAQRVSFTPNVAQPFELLLRGGKGLVVGAGCVELCGRALRLGQLVLGVTGVPLERQELRVGELGRSGGGRGRLRLRVMPLRGRLRLVQLGLGRDPVPCDLGGVALSFGKRSFSGGLHLQLTRKLIGCRIVRDALLLEVVEQRAEVIDRPPELVNAQDGIEALAAQARHIQEVRRKPALRHADDAVEHLGRPAEPGGAQVLRQERFNVVGALLEHAALLEIEDLRFQ